MSGRKSEMCREALLAHGYESVNDMKPTAFGRDIRRNRAITQAVIFLGMSLKSQAMLYGVNTSRVYHIAQMCVRRCLGERRYLEIWETTND